MRACKVPAELIWSEVTDQLSFLIFVVRQRKKVERKYKFIKHVYFFI